jgi:hypothetical protein
MTFRICLYTFLRMSLHSYFTGGIISSSSVNTSISICGCDLPYEHGVVRLYHRSYVLSGAIRRNATMLPSAKHRLKCQVWSYHRLSSIEGYSRSLMVEKSPECGAFVTKCVKRMWSKNLCLPN